MNLAISLRYMTMGQENAVWNVRWMASEDHMHLAKKYGIGVVAVLSKEAIGEICASCDGLIVPGSATDIPPAYYNGAPLEKDPPVDEYDLDSALIKHFYENGKPILGLCGGHQAINVFFGGGLRRIPDSKAHENDTAHEHKINIVRDSFVWDVFGTERTTVNSYHAWEIYGIAPDLSVVATTDDGVAEAIEWKKHNIYATQWHPELSLRKDDAREHMLFKNFLHACENCR
ncbi:MAG: gamma-glutamyl-gamma-aminobutyrate hydrolase family protein [Ruminococcaceae bacterium]|nr:gamma-glutamyl-gamma-aminobutyrate hydrolase family protein [Oscillospiraceae bacterium]